MNKIATIIISTLFLALPAFAESDALKVIVFPLYGPSESESIAWVGEGIAASLSAQLRGPMLHIMERDQVMEQMNYLGFFSGARLSQGSMISIAQKASADLAVMGSFEGTEKNLRIAVRIFYLEELRFSGSISANGPLSVLPQLENELAWQITTDIGIERSMTRDEYYGRTRKIPNPAFELYIESLVSASENDRRRLLVKAIDYYANFPEAQFRLGKLYYSKGDWKNALSHLTLAGIKDDAPAANTFILGTCYLQANQPRLAIEAYTRILRNSRPFEAFNNLGVAYLRESEDKLALNAFSEANILAPASPIISLNLSITQNIQGDVSAAIGTAEEAIESNPTDGLLQLLLGFLLKSRGEDKKAAIAYQEAAIRGISTEKLLTQDPKTWIQVFLNLSVP